MIYCVAFKYGWTDGQMDKQTDPDDRNPPQAFWAEG